MKSPAQFRVLKKGSEAVVLKLPFIAWRFLSADRRIYAPMLDAGFLQTKGNDSVNVLAPEIHFMRAEKHMADWHIDRLSTKLDTRERQCTFICAKRKAYILRKFRTVPDLTPAAARLWAAVAPCAPFRPAPADGDGGDRARRGVVHGHHAVLLEQPVAVGGVPLVAVAPQHQAVLDRLCARRRRVEEDGLAPLQAKLI